MLARNITKWRLAVLERDNNSCQRCHCDELIIAHHIKSIEDYPGLMLEVDNGRALCRTCHIVVHNAIRPSRSCYPRHITRNEDGTHSWTPLIPEGVSAVYH